MNRQTKHTYNCYETPHCACWSDRNYAIIKQWTPVIVNNDGRESEFKAVDPDGIPKNVSFQWSDGTPYLCTSYGSSSKVFTPIPS